MVTELIEDKELLTVEQVAAYLQLHRVTIYKYIRSGRLPAARLGRLYRICRSDIETLLETLSRNGKG